MPIEVVSIGVVRDPKSFQEKYDCINDNDRAYGTMYLAIPPAMHYLLDFVDYAFELSRNLEEALGIRGNFNSKWAF